MIMIMLMTILIIDTWHYTTTIINKNIYDNADNDSDILDNNAKTDNADNDNADNDSDILDNNANTDNADNDNA